MTTCEHDWHLEKETLLTYWHYPVRRTLFRKRLVVQDGWGSGTYDIFGWRRRWYCSRCRAFDVVEERTKTIEDVLREGRSVYDWEAREYLMPDAEDVAA